MVPISMSCLEIGYGSSQGLHSGRELVIVSLKLLIYEIGLGVAFVAGKLCISFKPRNGSEVLTTAPQADHLNRGLVEWNFPHI